MSDGNSRVITVRWTADMGYRVSRPGWATEPTEVVDLGPLVAYIAREVGKHGGTERVDEADEAYGFGYVQALDDILEWLAA
jgi:hypothetical protein